MKFCLLIFALLPLFVAAQSSQSLPPGSYINALSIGLKADAAPGGGGRATDNHPRLQRYLDSLPANSIAHIYFPQGGYYFSKTILVSRGKGIDFRGVRTMPYLGHQSASRLYFAADQTGISVIGGRLENGAHAPGALTSSISDIGLAAYGSTRGSRSAGLYHETICHLERVYAEGFGFGFFTFAEVAYPMHGNTSLSIYLSCRAARNKLDGFHAAGPDANAISYINCVSVLNNRWGFLDSSLLGNFYYGCQTATNGRDGSEAIAPYQGGGYGVMQGDAHAIISGCYSEGDQLPNHLPPVSNANVVGGLHPNGWCSNLPGQPFREPGGSVQSGAAHSRVHAKKIETPELSLGNGIRLSNTSQYGQGARSGIYDDSTAMVEVIGAGVPYAPFAAPSRDGLAPKRSIPGNSIALHKAQWVNGMLHTYGDTTMTDVVFLYGDRIINDAWTEGEPDYWRVVRPGRNQRLKPMAIQETGQWYGTPDLQRISLSKEADYHQLRVGDILNMSSGATGQVWDVNTKYLVEIRRPATAIKTGEAVNFMGGWQALLTPEDYSDSTLLLSYAPYEKHFTVGENAVVDGLPTTVKSVRLEKGVQLVELNFPAGAKPEWFRAGNGIGWGADNVSRLPAYYDHSDPARPTVTLAFPMPGLEAGAGVWVNGQKSTVFRIYTPGIAVKSLEGKVGESRPGSTFTVQQPKFKAY